MKNRKITSTILGALLFVFGLITLFLSSAIFLDLFNVREQEGNYVLLVVWANWLCSLLYLIAAYGFIKRKPWTFGLLLASTGILVLAFAGLLIHINSGGLYETKTIGALIFRTVITLIFALLAWTGIKKRERKHTTI
ncbi:MAG TPA: hypothetical protein DCL86_15400 [Bacteroidales bacterium]|jgi:hypothetical protein|nr:hypothetical protein [Lentimicrobium sp.]HAH59528.1 hypothetical protein [Bacteroidales bacterium]